PRLGGDPRELAIVGRERADRLERARAADLTERRRQRAPLLDRGLDAPATKERILDAISADLAQRGGGGPGRARIVVVEGGDQVRAVLGLRRVLRDATDQAREPPAQRRASPLEARDRGGGGGLTDPRERALAGLGELFVGAGEQVDHGPDLVA